MNLKTCCSTAGAWEAGGQPGRYRRIEYIERLSVYLAQTGRCYKSHYAAILNWWRRDGMPVRRSPAPRVLKPDVGREITPDMTAEELF